MEISNNIDSVIIDIDKLTFKKQNTNDDFIINLQPTKENNTNVLSSNVPLKTDNIYLSGLPGIPNIVTKLNDIDTSFGKVDASLVDLYANGGGGGGNGTFSGAATSLKIGTTNIALPDMTSATQGKVLIYNGDSNNPALEWVVNGTGSGIDYATFNTFKQLTDASFQNVDLSINDISGTLYPFTINTNSKFTVVDSSINDISSTLYPFTISTNNKFTVVDSSISDISSTLDDFRTTANSNFTTIINELATTNDKFDTNDARFVTVNANFNSFDYIIADICNNHIKKLLDTSNSLLFGEDGVLLPVTVGADGQVLKYDSGTGGMVWTNAGSGSSNTLTFDTSNIELPDTIGTDNGGQVLKYDSINEKFVWGDAGGTSGVLSFGANNEDLPNSLPANIAGKDHVIVYHNDNLVWKDVSFDGIDNSFTSIDNSFIGVNGVNATFTRFDNDLAHKKNRLDNLDTSCGDILTLTNSNKSEVDSSFVDLSGTVSNILVNVNSNITSINNINQTSTLVNYYTTTILDSSYTDISSTLHDLSGLVYTTNNTNTSNFFNIDTSFNKTDASLIDLYTKNTERKAEITTIETNIATNVTNINAIDERLLTTETTVTNQGDQITTLNNYKTAKGQIDVPTGNSNNPYASIELPTGASQPGKALVVKSDDNTKFEWANVKEITKDVDVDLLNLNIYGSTDISGNIRVVDEVIVGMENGNESIRTKGLIKTNSVTLHNITFPNNLDHADRTIDISKQEIYHDISGIHLTKTYLHDVDISGVIKPLPTNSIVTPLGVTIKFL